MKITQDPSKRFGFTLIELLTVIAVMGVLAGILIPILAGMRERSFASQSLSNLRQIGQAFFLYAQDNNNRLPAAGGFDKREDDGGWQPHIWSGMLHPYVANTPFSGDFSTLNEVFVCPVWERSNDYNPEAPWNSGYGMNYRLFQPTDMGSLHTPYSVAQIDHMTRGRPVVLVAASKDWHVQIQRWNLGYFDNSGKLGAERYAGQGQYLFFDGNVEQLSPEEAKKYAH